MAKIFTSMDNNTDNYLKLSLTIVIHLCHISRHSSYVIMSTYYITFIKYSGT